MSTTINSLETYLTARQTFRQQSTSITFDDINNSMMGKILKGIIKPPYNPISLANGKYTILGNRVQNDENWQQEDNPGASMSRTHKFLVPTVTSDWRYANALFFPASQETLALIDEMENYAMEFSTQQNITNPILLVHCYPNNSIMWLHLHILDGDNLGPSYRLQSYKNLLWSDVRRAIEYEMKM